MSDEAPKGPPMRTFNYRTHIGPNESGLHDAAVHAQQIPTGDDGDAGRETGSPALALPAAPATPKED